MATLAGWNFQGAGGKTTVPPSTTTAGLTAVAGIGSGLMPFNYLGNGLTGRKQTKLTLVEAKADNEYVYWKLTPAAGKTLTIREIRLRPVSQNRARSFTLTVNGRDIKTFTAVQLFLPLTSISFTDLNALTGPIEFRLYIYGHTDEWESVGLGERQAGLNELDLMILGEVGIANSQDITAPSVPTGVTSSNITASGFTVSWAASTDNVAVASYEVLLNGASRSTVTHPTRTLDISGLTANTTYSVTVRARDAAGNVSAASTAISVRTLSGPPVTDTQPPSVPTGLSASNITTSGFTVSWNASTDNVGVASYEVFVNGTSHRTVNHPTTTLTITGLTTATTAYSVTVRARDAAGNVSAASTAISVGNGGPYPNSRSRMGINLTGVYDYSEEQPFKDVFKTSRPWNYDNHPERLVIDTNGWVSSLNGQPSAVAYVMVNDNNPADVYEAGPYVLLYDGEGTIALAGAGVSRISFAPGRIEYNITQPGNHWVEITATNANNYIRNIRLVPKIYEADYQTNPWRPYILNRWAEFKTLRFMDWMNTNNSRQVNWTARTLTTRATYSSYNPASSGIPLELITDLSNRLHADAWINIPHLASNDYVTQLATYLRDHLDRTLKIYIEYSNECWNPQFEQARYCEQNGRAAYPQFTPFEAQLRWYSRRSVEIFKIFAAVFGGTSRLVRTLGAQQGNPWTVEVVLNHDDAPNNTDAVAIAPYFGHEYACAKYQQVKAWTLAQFFNDIRTVSLPLAWQNTKDCISIIKARGKLAVAYEGGQHFTGAASWACNGVDTFEDAALNSKFYDANVNTEMGNVYTIDLNKWRELGGDMYCTFSAVGNYSKHGYWGLLRFPNQNPSNAPKYQAVLNWLRNNPS